MVKNYLKDTDFRERLCSLAAVAAALIFLVLAVGSSLTHRPQVDEGLFASPAYNLAYNGHFGTTIFEMENSALTRIDERTYWVMPTFLLNVAASFKIFGFGIFQMRLVSIFWAVILFVAGYFIAEKLSGSRNVGFLSVILLACNYTVLDTASSGRMDLMSAALGFAGLAAYLVWRERNLALAVFLGQTFIAASGLTHHNGIMAFVGLTFFIFYFDFKRLRWQHLGLAAVPYFIGGGLFGTYVLQDFQAFHDQFIGNATMGGRLKGFGSPLAGIIAEFTKRYPHAYGFQTNSGGHSGPIYLKSLILIGYIAGLAGVLLTKSLRVKYLPLLILTATYFIIMGLIDGQKETPYLIHIVPIYCILLAIWLNHLLENRFVPALLVVVGICALAVLQVGGMALRIKQNTNGNYYQPTVAYLKQNLRESDTIFGGSELVFGLNFSDKLIGDARFGQITGKRPRFIVYDDAIHSSWRNSKEFAPEFYDYFPRLLGQEYKIVYENAAYKIYEQKAQ